MFIVLFFLQKHLLYFDSTIQYDYAGMSKSNLKSFFS